MSSINAPSPYLSISLMILFNLGALRLFNLVTAVLILSISTVWFLSPFFIWCSHFQVPIRSSHLCVCYYGFKVICVFLAPGVFQGVFMLLFKWMQCIIDSYLVMREIGLVVLHYYSKFLHLNGFTGYPPLRYVLPKLQYPVISVLRQGSFEVRRRRNFCLLVISQYQEHIHL